MGNFLAATGRARPTRTMLDVLQGKLAIESGDRRERLVNNELMESNERLEQSRRINQQEEEKIAQGNKYHSLSTLDGQIYGGLKSPQGKRLVKIARGMGLLNYDIAPEGAIRDKDFSRVHQELLRPVTAKALANDVVEYERSNLNALQSELSEITTQLSEKDNPKLRERQQQLLTQLLPEQSIKYNASLDNLEGVSEVLDREIDEAKAAKTASRAMRTYMDPDDPTKTETIPNNQEPSVNPSGKKYVPYSHQGESPEEKDRRVLALEAKKQELRNKFAMKLAKAKARWKGENPDTLSVNDRRILDKELAIMALSIESDPTGPGTRQAAKFFNDYATGNYVYLFQERKRKYLSDKEETLRIDLPILNGEQITARDIRETMSLPKYKGKTLSDLLRHLGAIE